jgi:flagellar basal body P-ring protein FlgI
MGIFREFFEPMIKRKTLVISLKRSDYYKLQMIADDINEHSGDEDYVFTPEVIANQVMKTFIDEAYQDSTRRIVKAILPEVHKRRR